ncbi:MAG TPA: hypothetical protein VHQ70_06205 [Syntrophomonadaceae bacterium]|nr:hypothetical protein [Syntrophomonadaceae bacterium]
MKITSIIPVLTPKLVEYKSRIEATLSIAKILTIIIHRPEKQPK